MARKKVDEWEVSGFGIVEDDKLSEWHQVADQGIEGSDPSSPATPLVRV
jgi:hypothetical protein